MVFEAFVVDGEPSNFEDPRRNPILDDAWQIRQSKFDFKTLGQQHVSADALKLLQSYDQGSAQQRQQLLESDGDVIVHGLVALFANLSQLKSLKYIITLLDDMLVQNDKHTALIINAAQQPLSADGSLLEAWAPFVRQLERTEDTYLEHQCARVVVRLVLAGLDMDTRGVTTLLKWTDIQLRGGDRPGILLALIDLGRVLRKDCFRFAVAKDELLLSAIKLLLTPTSHMQQQYLAIRCLWVLTFNNEATSALVALHALVPLVCDIVVEATKEKLVRVALSFLRNVLVKTEKATSHELAVLMITHKLLPRVESMIKTSEYADEELVDAAEETHKHLKMCFENLSSFDEYVAELKSGTLQWSPVHRSERFWRQSVTRLNDEHHALLKLLVAYLDDASSPLSTAIAIHDCGEYVRHYPFGKKALVELGAKAKIMAHLQSTDNGIRYEALIALQKMMTDHWEFLGQQAQKESEKTGPSA